MRLSDKWFTALSESDDGHLVFILGREDLDEFRLSGKLKERVEITWKYKGDTKRMPTEEEVIHIEETENTLKKVMEKDKLAVMTAVYTGNNEKIWVFYTRTTKVFGERLNETLKSEKLLPITIAAEVDENWEEYLDMYDLKKYAAD